MAAPWEGCCRGGSTDARGKNSLLRVSGDYRCCGTSKVAAGQRKYAFASQDKLDTFFHDAVRRTVRELGGGSQLPQGVTEAAAAAALRDEVVPVHVVDTPRVCKWCWKAAGEQRLPAALGKLKATLVFPQTENTAPPSTAAAAPAAAPASPAARAAAAPAALGSTAGNVHAADTGPADEPGPKRLAVPGTPVTPAGESELDRLRRENAEQRTKILELERSERLEYTAKRNQYTRAEEWKGREAAGRAREREQTALLDSSEERAAAAAIADLRKLLRRTENERDVLQRAKKKAVDEQPEPASASASASASTRTGSDCTLDGIILSLMGTNPAGGKDWVIGQYRDALVELHERYHVSMEKALPCLLMVLRATGLEVTCSVTDSEHLVAQILVETAEMLQLELARDLLAAHANVDADEWEPPVEEPKYGSDIATLAHPRANKGPMVASDDYQVEVYDKAKTWAASGQEHGELIKLPAGWPFKPLTLKEYCAKYSIAATDISKIRTLPGMPSVLALYDDDTKKWNLRQLSAGLLSGPGLTAEGERPRIFFLTEVFAEGGSTGDSIAVLDAFIETRQRQMAIGETDPAKMTWLYYVISFVFDNCSSMKGRFKGLHAKLEQVRRRALTPHTPPLSRTETENSERDTVPIVLYELSVLPLALALILNRSMSLNHCRSCATTSTSG